jgi:hypothetical protein
MDGRVSSTNSSLDSLGDFFFFKGDLERIIAAFAAMPCIVVWYVACDLSKKRLKAVVKIAKRVNVVGMREGLVVMIRKHERKVVVCDRCQQLLDTTVVT